MIYMGIITIVFAIVMIPDIAFAWGPATHLELGMDILRNTNFIVPAIRELIWLFPYDYLYGNISADIVVAKNLTKELKHCHNWKVGFNLLKKVESDSQKSFAYGYLSHLAADTIAHNLFIPRMMVESFSTSIHRHIYWELRFDALADKSVWKVPKKIEKEVHRDNDKLLDTVIHDTLFSFRTNKTIFSSIILLHGIKKWHQMIDILSSRSKWKLKKEDRAIYYNLAYDAVVELLNKGDAAACLNVDPRGKARLNMAMLLRSKLKKLKRNDHDWEDALDKALKKIGS